MLRGWKVSDYHDGFEDIEYFSLGLGQIKMIEQLLLDRDTSNSGNNANLNLTLFFSSWTQFNAVGEHEMRSILIPMLECL